MVWDDLCLLLSGLTLPVLVVGDYNQVFDSDDKWSMSMSPIQGLAAGHSFLQRSGLINVHGARYSWTNGRCGENATFEKLDRVMCS